jgi:hypothetical protein
MAQQVKVLASYREGFVTKLACQPASLSNIDSFEYITDFFKIHPMAKEMGSQS